MKKTIFVLSLIFLFKSLSCQNNLTGIWVSNYKETIEIKQINQVLNITLSDNEGVREISDLENSNGVFIGKMNFISRKLRCFQKLTIIEPNILLSEYTNCSDCVNRLSTFWIKSNRQYDNLSSNEINNFYEKFLALLRDYGEKNKYAYAFEAAYKISNDLKDKQKFEKFNEIDNNNVSIKSNEINKDVSIKKEQIVPPMLSVSNIAFTDKNSNNRIDGNEECSINFTITNKGKGAARNMKIIVQNNSTITGLIFTTTTTLGTISPNSSQNVTLPISGSMNLTTGIANVKISFEEQMGFSPDPFDLNIDTKEFTKPDVKVVDFSFLTDNGTIKLGMPIQLKCLVQNLGQGIADDVNVNFQIPQTNVFPNGQKDFVLGTLNANASQKIVFEFIANKLYTDKTIPVTIKLSEKYGKFSEDKQVSASIDTKSSGTTINVTSNATDNKVDIQVASLSADVDKNIPQIATKFPNRYALIIGNENYSKYQTGLNSESNVDYAGNDATTFAKYAEKTLGVPKENITLLIDVIGSKMKSEIEKICKIAGYSNGEAEIIFFYAGHGFPDEKTKEGYIIPVDITGVNVKEGILLTKLYQQLTKNPVNRVTVFLDACFSGGGRNAGLLAARGVKIKPKEGLIEGNLVVFSASSGDQTSLPYKDKAHGMFTYFLLKKIQETKGNINYKDLADFIKKEVQLNSVKINSKDQNPDVLYNPQIEGQWENWNFK